MWTGPSDSSSLSVITVTGLIVELHSSSVDEEGRGLGTEKSAGEGAVAAAEVRAEM